MDRHTNKTQQTWSPARADRDTAFAFALPESLPAFPPAYQKYKMVGREACLVSQICSDSNKCYRYFTAKASRQLKRMHIFRLRHKWGRTKYSHTAQLLLYNLRLRMHLQNGGCSHQISTKYLAANLPLLWVDYCRTKDVVMGPFKLWPTIGLAQNVKWI